MWPSSSQHFFSTNFRRESRERTFQLDQLKSGDDLKSLKNEPFLVIGLFKDQNGEKANIYNDLIRGNSLKDAKFAISSEKVVNELFN